jgi:hypothetical protein
MSYYSTSLWIVGNIVFANISYRSWCMGWHLMSLYSMIKGDKLVVLTSLRNVHIGSEVYDVTSSVMLSSGCILYMIWTLVSASMIWVFWLDSTHKIKHLICINILNFHGWLTDFQSFGYLWDFRFSWQRVWSLESSGVSCHVVTWKLSDISEVCTVSIIRAMMNAVRTSEMLVNFNMTTWRYIPEDCTWLHGTTSQKTLNFFLVTRSAFMWPVD